MNFRWQDKESPGLDGIPSNNFSVRWSGQLEVVEKASYTFTTRSDDGVRLWIGGNDTPIIDNWTLHGAADDHSKPITLEPGRYDLRLEYFEHEVDAEIKLQWSTTSMSKRIIESKYLHPGPVTTVPGPPSSPTKNGLAAVYVDSTGASVHRTDANIDFDWKKGSPVAGIAKDRFGVTWKGQLQIDNGTEGSYRFMTRSDDRIRVEIDGVIVIENWTLHPATNNWSKVVKLGPGRHTIKVEYAENEVNAEAKLYWMTPGSAQATIIDSRHFWTQ